MVRSGNLLVSSAPRAQRRHVTILFSDICSWTELGESIDPNDTAEILHRVRQVAHDVVGRHHGVLNQLYGDGMLIVFGYPKPREDDVKRAIEAALELHAKVRDLALAPFLPDAFRLRLHSGVHSGLVVAEDGDGTQGRYELIGDPTNTAARLAEVADRDEVVVSAATLSGAKPYFVAEALPPFELKGKRERVPAYRVLRRSGVITRFEASVRRGLTPFVGRELELSQLQQHLHLSRQGRLQVASIVGDAGLGKTRTAEEFLSQQGETDCTVYRGYFQSDRSGAPLQPFLQMLRQHFPVDPTHPPERARGIVRSRLAELGDSLASHLPALLQVLSVQGESAASADRSQNTDKLTVTACTELFLALAGNRPLVLFIDDWQLADDASRQVLGGIVQAAQDDAVLVLTSSRELDPSDPAMSGSIIRLDPFDEQSSKQAIGTLMPYGLEVDMTALIHERSGGNVLFIEELCQSLSSWAPNYATDGNAHKVPPTLHGLIESRVERLPQVQAELVRTAAIIGNVIPSWLLQRISGYGDIDDAIRELADNDLIYAGDAVGTLRFKHGITRDVIYESIRQQRRRRLHLQIAEVLCQSDASGSSEDQFETLAYHYARSGNNRQASRFAELAGDKALSSSSLDRARQQYRAALAALERMPQNTEVHQRWVSVSRRWALACTYSPSLDRLDILHRTISHARELNDMAGVAHANYWLGWIHYALGKQTAAIGHYRQALRLANGLGEEKLATQLLATIGQSHAAACQYPQALAYLDPAIAVKRRHPSRHNPPVGSAYALACKGFVLADRGEFSNAHGCIEQALQAVRGADQAIEGSILNIHCAILLWQGRWDRCIELAKHARAAAERFSLPYIFAMSQAVESYARWQRERAPDAQERLRQSAAWLEAREIRLYFSLNCGWLADTMADAGRDDVAESYASRALRQAKRQDPMGLTMAYRALAKIASRSQNASLETPEYYLDMALQSAKARGSAHDTAVTQLHQAERFAVTGRNTQASELLDQARNAFTEMQMSRHLDVAEQLARSLGGERQRQRSR